ncbi:uncharacterized protein LACBIDRAFT_328039 [Laccaria bicolor S238N-H82]|uniref:Predicted protein n=1 Tax=Laccaria bicolor (strain S238N-H82 / ATCC MYA-4686) TaxID=486041 RepID=B0DE96_LACBS|nr:uncharacterized protein LACBIDRAFT_328039 [Laccaria bicolor S238N-H82]EDR07097.1 predicted protein [Laccaria bicolor S238N-H82]|eukprot:XP_001882028.1 predicted protein [Laccaria bicolor S238N-H82]
MLKWLIEDVHPAPKKVVSTIWCFCAAMEHTPQKTKVTGMNQQSSPALDAGTSVPPVPVAPVASDFNIPASKVPGVVNPECLKVQSQDCKKTATGPDQDCKRPDLQSWSFRFEITRPQKNRLTWTGLVG